MLTGDSPAHNTLTGEIIYLEVTIGSFVCKSATPTCLIGSDMPPVEIQVHTIWTVNDFTGKDPRPGETSRGLYSFCEDFNLERPHRP